MNTSLSRINNNDICEPLISVAMPVFNSANTLKAAINSIILQTYDNWELLLIDDGSNDASIAVAKEFHDLRICLFADGQHRGLSARLNEAIDLAKGSFIARMDSDDISFPERFDSQVRYLREHPDIDILGTGAVVFDDSGSITGRFPFRISHSEICRRPWNGFYLPHPTWMGRINWFRQFRYGGSEVFRAEDQDMLLRSCNLSRFGCMDNVLFGYRQNKLPIKSVLAGRLSLTKSIIREALRQKQYHWLPLAIVGQTSKGMFEWMICALKLEKPMLKHRALPIADEELTIKWQKIWKQCHD